VNRAAARLKRKVQLIQTDMELALSLPSFQLIQHFAITAFSGKETL
jgi:hypothetical protein